MSIPYPWLESTQRSVTAMISRGRLPHALLLTGQPGTGKASFAVYLAQTLLCEQTPRGESPCGQCKACTLFRAGSHPDFLRLQPEEDSSVIKVDQVRGLITDLSLSSHRGGYKVAILDPADSMNISAANSLLKTLEEPTDNTVLLLVSARPGRLPATLRSRCQRLRIVVQEPEVVRDWLSREFDTQEAGMYLQLAGNAPLEALRLAQEGALEARREHFAQLVDILDGRVAPLAVAVGWSKDENMRAVHWFRDWLMDLLKLRLTGTRTAVGNVDLLDGLEALAGRLDSKLMFFLLDRVNRSLQLAGSSLNRQLMTEDILLAWADMG